MSDSVDISDFRRGIFSSVGFRVMRGIKRHAESLAQAKCIEHESGSTLTSRRLGSDVRSALLCYADTFRGNTILLVDPLDRQKDIGRWLASNCLRPHVLGTLAHAAQVIEAGVQRVGLVVVDLDSCGGISRVAHELLGFRLKFVEVPVILVSAESLMDDFSTVRLPIGDVTLRGPVSVARLDLALAEAQINNRVWQSRNGAPPQ